MRLDAIDELLPLSDECSLAATGCRRESTDVLQASPRLVRIFELDLELAEREHPLLVSNPRDEELADLRHERIELSNRNPDRLLVRARDIHAWRVLPPWPGGLVRCGDLYDRRARRFRRRYDGNDPGRWRRRGRMRYRLTGNDRDRVPFALLGDVPERHCILSRWIRYRSAADRQTIERVVERRSKSSTGASRPVSRSASKTSSIACAVS